MSVPPDVMERIAATVRDLAQTPEVKTFSISRSSAPAAESRALGADALVDLFRSDDPTEVQEVFVLLTERFAAHEKARDPDAGSPMAATHVLVALFAVADVEKPNTQRLSIDRRRPLV